MATPAFFSMFEAKNPMGKNLDANARVPVLLKCVSCTNITSAPESLKLLRANCLLQFKLRPFNIMRVDLYHVEGGV